MEDKTSEKHKVLKRVCNALPEVCTARPIFMPSTKKQEFAAPQQTDGKILNPQTNPWPNTSECLLYIYIYTYIYIIFHHIAHYLSNYIVSASFKPVFWGHWHHPGARFEAETLLESREGKCVLGPLSRLNVGQENGRTCAQDAQHWAFGT